ncbi:methyltransferase domain-containing protein [PVC group bacterium]|nr:methyltransferase domain-containing protein [PVC group bacterium]
MEIQDFKNIEQIQSWIDSQQWYQKIELSNGLETPGKIDSSTRLPLIKKAKIKEQSVLDIGCNSGYYCLWAKKNGASRVVGIDIDEHRLKQAEVISRIEQCEIEYYHKPIKDALKLGVFDTVFCFAVLTEIPDLLGSLEDILALTGQKAFIEMAVARPLCYLSRSVSWLKSFIKKRYSKSVIEMRPIKQGGWALVPSMGALRRIAGNNFKVSYLGKGTRYDMICIERISEKESS